MFHSVLWLPLSTVTRSAMGMLNGSGIGLKGSGDGVQLPSWDFPSSENPKPQQTGADAENAGALI